MFVFVGLLIGLEVAEPAQAQYPSYSYAPTTNPTTSATSTPLPSAISSGTNLVLYEGPLTSGASGNVIFGFGETSNNITSPGPTLYLQEGTTYTMTVYNLDTTTSHAWEIVPTKAVSSTPMFGAGIDITSFIPPGGSGSVTFTANETGNFYYVCTHAGHIDYGMYGNVVVTGPVPEFSSPIGILLTLLALAAASALAMQIKTKNKIVF
jgi:hypothetical protein